MYYLVVFYLLNIRFFEAIDRVAGRFGFIALALLLALFHVLPLVADRVVVPAYLARVAVAVYLRNCFGIRPSSVILGRVLRFFLVLVQIVEFIISVLDFVQVWQI